MILLGFSSDDSMQRFALIIAAFLSLLPAAFAVDSYQSLQRDVKTFDEDMAALEVEGKNDVADLDRESYPELFPTEGEEKRGSGELGGPNLSVRLGSTVLTFGDVPRTEWFFPFVRDMVERRIISGYRDAAGKPLGIFGPARNVSLEELAAMTVRAARIDADLCPLPPLNLTASGTWSGPVVSCAETLGWVLYADGTVDVKRPATRAEVVTTILQAFDILYTDASGTIFRDVPSTLLFAPAIERAARDHIVAGYADSDGNPTGLFGPSDPVKRAEVAKMLSLALQVYGSQ